MKTNQFQCRQNLQVFALCMGVAVSSFAFISQPAAAQTMAHNFTVVTTAVPSGGYTFSGTCDDAHKVKITGKHSPGQSAKGQTNIKLEFTCNSPSAGKNVSFTNTGKNNTFKFDVNTVFSSKTPATVMAPSLAAGTWDFESVQFLSKTAPPNVDVLLPRFQLTL